MNLKEENTALKAENDRLREEIQRQRHCVWLLTKQLGGAAFINVSEIMATAENFFLASSESKQGLETAILLEALDEAPKMPDEIITRAN